MMDWSESLSLSIAWKPALIRPAQRISVGGREAGVLQWHNDFFGRGGRPCGVATHDPQIRSKTDG